MLQRKKNKYQRINYRINFCSDQDRQYPCSQLLLQSPQSKGWQTSRYCQYPQNLIIQFVQPMQLKQISVLSHQHKITSRIELQYKLQKQKQFKRLGHFSLSNEDQNMPVRFLKNVDVDVACMFLRFIIMKNHINKHNLFNQVGIISICVYGQRLISHKIQNQLKFQEIQNNKTPKINQKQKQISQFDKNIMKRLKELQIAKAQAVQSQDFQAAKQYKLQIEQLKKIGNYLADLEQRKRIAVLKQDYDSAKIIQQQIRKTRQLNGGGPNITMQPSNYNMIPKQPLRKKNIQNNQLLIQNDDIASISPVTRVSQRQINQNDNRRPSRNQTIRNLPPRNQNQYNQISRNQTMKNQTLQQQQKQQQVKSFKKPIKNEQIRIKTTTNKKSYGNDEISIGGKRQNPKNYGNDQVPIAVKNSDPYGMNNPDANIQGQVVQQEEKVISKPENLKPENAKLADSFSDVFNQQIFKLIFSKSHQNRQSGIEQIKNIIEKPNKIEKNRLMAGILVIVKATIQDKIATIILGSMDLFDRYLKKYKPNTSDTSGNLDYIMCKLADYQGNTNQKIKMSAFQLYSQFPKYGLTNKNNSIKGLTTYIGKKAPSPKILIGRLDMIKKILQQFKVGNNFQQCIQYAVKYVDDKNGEVRNSSMALIKFLIDESGYNKVAPFLKNVRPPILKSIQAMADPETVERQNIQPPQEEVIVTTNINPQGNKKKTQGKQPNKIQRQRDEQKKIKNPQFYCDFCDKYDQKFQDDNYRDIHLFNACPMLILCQCKQAIEVSTYTAHLLSQCQNHQYYKKCPRCHEAIHQKNYNAHTKAKQCLPAKPISSNNRCPLCHEDIEYGEQGWKRHLAVEGCPNHNRG